MVEPVMVIGYIIALTVIIERRTGVDKRRFSAVPEMIFGDSDIFGKLAVYRAVSLYLIRILAGHSVEHVVIVYPCICIIGIYRNSVVCKQHKTQISYLNALSISYKYAYIFKSSVISHTLKRYI